MSEMVLVPDYFENFHCVGADCKYNCCQGWTVSLNKQDYMKIRSLKPSPQLQEKIDVSLKRFKKSGDDEIYAQFVQNEESQLCPFLDEAGLCTLQIESGYKSLPTICQNFPRFMSNLFEPMEGFSTGCEYVVKLLMQSDETTYFKEIPLEKSDLQVAYNKNHVAVLEYRPILRSYSQIRNLCIGVMQNRSYSLDNRMILLGIVMNGLTELEQSQKLDNLPIFIKQKQAIVFGNEMTESLNRLASNSQLCTLNNISLCIKRRLNANAEFVRILDEVFENLGVQCDKSEENMKISYSITKYEAAMAELKRQNMEIIFEKVLVNNFFAFNYPFTSPTIWDTFISLCNFYSLLKFMTAGFITSPNALAAGKTQEDLIHLITVCSRFISHSAGMDTAKQFEENESATLAHMVIMIKG